MQQKTFDKRCAAVEKKRLTDLPSGTVSGERICSPYLKETVYRWKLSNGLSVLFLPKAMTTTVAQFTVRFGSSDLLCPVVGRKLPPGIAHFIEHSLFTMDDGSDINERFSALGADSNAWTDGEKTTYLFTTAEKPEEALHLLLQFASHAHFSAPAMEHERGIIREEIRAGEESPSEKLELQTLRALYPHHAIGKPICGTKQSIEKLTPELLYKVFSTFYRPENMFVTVCGNMEAEKVISAVADELGDWYPEKECARPAGGAEKRIRKSALPVTQEVLHTAALSQPMFSIGWRDRVAESTEGSLLHRSTLMEIVSEALFARAGAFYGELYGNGMLSGSYDYGYNRIAGLGYHTVYGDADDPERVRAAYWNYLAKIKKDGIARKDFERCRRILLAGFLGSLDDTEDVANLLLDAEEDRSGIFDVLRELEKITLREVNECLAAAFTPEDTVFSVLTPHKRTERTE